MQERLGVARALVKRPRIFFLHEPTEGLDPTSANAIRNVIVEERERGSTVFLTTHDMYEADKLSDRVAFINQGKIVALDTPYKLKQQYGKRLLKVEIETGDGQIEAREVTLDNSDTGETVKNLFESEKVI